MKHKYFSEKKPEDGAGKEPGNEKEPEPAGAAAAATGEEEGGAVASSSKKKDPKCADASASASGKDDDSAVEMIRKYMAEKLGFLDKKSDESKKKKVGVFT